MEDPSPLKKSTTCAVIQLQWLRRAITVEENKTSPQQSLPSSGAKVESLCVCLYLSDRAPLCISLFKKDYSSSSSFLVTELCNTRPEVFTNRDVPDIINVLTSFFYNLIRKATLPSV